MINVSVTVIISTYNRPDALVAVLQGLTKQIDPDFSIVVADDGSTDETKLVIQQFQEQFLGRLIHVWQPDEGFKAAEIRNKAVARAKSDYLIFIDGDCIPNKNFILRHKQLAEKGYFVAGNRVLLNKKFSDLVMQQSIPISEWNFSKWWRAYRRKQCNRFLANIKFPLGFLRKINKRKWKSARTCNLAIWRDDFVAVNGFDEAYQGWGFEDSDLVIRLLKNGIKHKSARFAVAVSHLWHPENDRSRLKENKARLKEIQNNPQIQAEIGVAQHIATAD
ncbi:MAG: glycosyltransferase family 2 protein [Gammaproteobacteria bacterium]